MNLANIPQDILQSNHTIVVFFAAIKICFFFFLSNCFFSQPNQSLENFA